MTKHTAMVRRGAAALLACTIAAAAVLIGGGTASAALVPAVPMGTAANYAVLGASTVTNVGNSVLNGSLGLSPGVAIVGFPPGLVVAPGTTDINNAAAQQAQSDLTAAYNNAAGRPLDATTTADLVNLTLQPGVYAGPGKGALSLTGPLILDGAGDLSSVFIFQTDSTLITGVGSTVTLINGAQECNVFWQVGSSATLGTSSVFAGTILALTSITVNNGVTVNGRALARNGAVTLDNDTFTRPTCAQPPPPPPQPTTTTTRPTTTTTTRPTTATTAAPSATTTRPTTATTAAPSATTTSTVVSGSVGDGTPTMGPPAPAGSAVVPGGADGVAPTTDPGTDVLGLSTTMATLPRTGSPIGTTLLLAAISFALGAVAIRISRAELRKLRPSTVAQTEGA